MATYYVDYVGGADTNNGTSTSTPFKHCPGDDNATDTAGSTTLSAGDIVKFKGGVKYRGRIDVDWSGSSGSYITYDLNFYDDWGTGDAILSGLNDSAVYTYQNIFYSTSQKSYIKILGGEITEVAVQSSENSQGAIRVWDGSDWLIQGVLFRKFEDWNVVSALGTNAPPDCRQKAIGWGNYNDGTGGNIEVDGCEFYGVGQWAFYAGGESGKGKWFKIHDCNFGGINRGSDAGYIHTAIDFYRLPNNVHIYDNVIHDCYKYHGNDSNYRANTGYGGITFSRGGSSTLFGSSCIIERNYLYNDVAFAYIWTGIPINVGEYAMNVIVKNNLIVNWKYRYGARMLQVGESSGGTQHVYVLYNTLVDFSDESGGYIRGINCLGDDTTTLQGNIVYSESSSSSCYNLYLSGYTNLVASDYNIFYNARSGDPPDVIYDGSQARTLSEWQTDSGEDANSDDGNPNLVDIPSTGATASSGNYRLSSSSTNCINQGPSTAPTGAFKSYPRDVGDTQQWAYSTSSAVEDTRSDDGDTSYVYDTNNNQSFLLWLDGFYTPDISISNITFYWKWRHTDGSGTATIWPGLRIDGSDYTGDQEVPTTYTDWSWSCDNNPDTSSPWALGEINTVQQGATHREAGTEIRITQLRAHITTGALISQDYYGSTRPFGTYFDIGYHEKGLSVPAVTLDCNVATPSLTAVGTGDTMTMLAVELDAKVAGTITPAELPTLSALGTPGVGSITLSAEVQTPSTIGAATLTLTAVSLSAAVQTPGTIGAALMTLTAVSATCAVQTPSTVGAATVVLSAVSLAASVQTPTSVGAATLNLTAVTLSAAVEAPSIESPNMSLDPVSLSCEVATPSTIGAATLSLSAVSAGADVPTPGLVGSASLSLTAVTLSAEVLSPSTIGAATLNLTAVSCGASVVSPTISALSTLNLLAVSASLTIQSPSLSASSILNAQAVAASASVATPSTIGAASLSLSAVAASCDVAEPSLDAGGPPTMSLLPVTLSAEVSGAVLDNEKPRLVSTSDVSLSAVSLSAAVQSPDLGIFHVLSLDPVALAADLATPALISASLMSLSAVAATAEVMAPDLDILTTVDLDPVEATFAVVSPHLNDGSFLAMSLEAIVLDLSVTTPGITAIPCEDDGLIGRVSEIIASRGKAILFNFKPKAEYDPTTMSVDDKGGIGPQSLKVTPPFPVRQDLIDNDVVMRGDLMCYFPGCPSHWPIRTGLTVRIDGVKWVIVATEPVPYRGSTAVILLVLRKLGRGARTFPTEETELDSRLVPRVKEIVDEHGIEATFDAAGKGAYDPEALITDPVNPSPVTVKITPFEFFEEEIVDGDVVRRGDVKCLLPAHLLAFEPTFGQDVTVEDKKYKIIGERPIYTGHKIALFELHMRGKSSQ